MILRSERVRLLGVALLISTACVGHALAEAPAVDALVKQAQYWRSKGRDDLAEQAMRRARALNPKVQAPAPAFGTCGFSIQKRTYWIPGREPLKTVFRCPRFPR